MFTALYTTIYMYNYTTCFEHISITFLIKLIVGILQIKFVWNLIMLIYMTPQI
jgi:hypothetical protein